MNDKVKIDDYLIEKNVPIQKSFRSRPGKWQKVLKEMEVEDSFLIDETEDSTFSQMNAIRNAATTLGIKVKGTRESEYSRRVHRTG
tara:strand:- start:845 stop:1102 length:258 start_codon:yes stop_codon:yes gene_type:complete